MVKILFHLILVYFDFGKMEYAMIEFNFFSTKDLSIMAIS